MDVSNMSVETVFVERFVTIGAQDFALRRPAAYTEKVFIIFKQLQLVQLV